MAPRPEDRYASPKVLADDIESWLADEPVSAWREPFSLRSRRWTRRHRTLVTSASAAMLIAVVGLAATSALLSEKNRALDAQRTRAEENEQLAIDAVKQFRDVIVNNPGLKSGHDLAPLRKSLLKEPLAFFRALRDRLASGRDARPGAVFRLVNATAELALTTDQIGDRDDARRTYGDAIALLENLVREHPESRPYRLRLAWLHRRLGQLYYYLYEAELSERSYEASNLILDRLVGEDPSDGDFRSEQVRNLIAIGENRRMMGKMAPALEAFRKAADLAQGGADSAPTDARFAFLQAHTLLEFGSQQFYTGEPTPGLESVARAAAGFERLNGRVPGNEEYQSALVNAIHRLGTHQYLAGRGEEAIRTLQKSLTLTERLVRDHPEVDDHWVQLSLNLHHLAATQHRISGDGQAAGKNFERCIEILERVVREHPETLEYQKHLAGALTDMALLETSQGRRLKALGLLQRAAKYQASQWIKNPNDPYFKQGFSEIPEMLKSMSAKKGQAKAADANKPVGGGESRRQSP